MPSPAACRSSQTVHCMPRTYSDPSTEGLSRRGLYAWVLTPYWAKYVVWFAARSMTWAWLGSELWQATAVAAARSRQAGAPSRWRNLEARMMGSSESGRRVACTGRELAARPRAPCPRRVLRRTLPLYRGARRRRFGELGPTPREGVPMPARSRAGRTTSSIQPAPELLG